MRRRKSYAEGMPETVALAKQLKAQGLSYRKISAKLAELGHVTRTGKPHVAFNCLSLSGAAGASGSDWGGRGFPHFLILKHFLHCRCWGRWGQQV